MSRKTKTLTISGKQITFTEIPANVVANLLRGGETGVPVFYLPLSEALEHLAALIPYAIDCSIDELLDLEMYSDDMAAIEAAFKETNPGFFDLARRLDLAGALGQLVKAIIGAYCSSLLSLPSGATETPESTDSVSSSI